jgi:phospholipid/cholesterol/gamma-HCH transport system substrate-binding protein
MVADLQALAPVLANLSDAGRNLPKSLQVLLTYPFTDEVLNGVKGDYLNVYLSVTALPGTQIIPPLVPGQAAQTKSSPGQAGGAPLPLPAVGGARTTPTGSPPATSPSTPASPSGSVPPGTPTATPSSSPNGGG